MKIRTILSLSLLFTTLYSGDNYFYQNGKKVYISPLKDVKTFSLKSISTPSDIKYFITLQNKTLGVSDEILIKTVVNIDILLNSYNITLVKQLTSNIYLVKINNQSAIFDTANRLYEDDRIEFAHPNFIRQINKR